MLIYATLYSSVTSRGTLMAKELISKAYDAATDTWTEVYRVRKPAPRTQAEEVENIEWPTDRDVFSAKELVSIYLGTDKIDIGDLLSYIKRWRITGHVTPLHGGKLIKIHGRLSRYYAVRNAERYTTTAQIRSAVLGR